MNLLDDNFEKIIEMITNSKEEELFSFVKEHYEKVPLDTQASLEHFLKEFPYWGKLNYSQQNFEELENRVKVLKENSLDLKEMYLSFNDYRSRKTLYAILKNWLEFSFTSLKKTQENCFYHYFDLDIIPMTKDEVFVDLGAYIGDTIYDYLNTYGFTYKKIYAYEMSKDNQQFLKENTKNFSNIVIREKAVSDFVGKGKIIENKTSSSANTLVKTSLGNISVTTLDEDIQEKITMLKMDIEGSELSALKGATRHLKEDKPKLMISIYHGHKDLIEIWKYIKSLDIDYHFSLRYYGGPIFPTEIVLYAIP